MLGLECKSNHTCACSYPCQYYIKEIDSCDCDYEYPYNPTWQIVVGVILGIISVCFWCICWAVACPDDDDETPKEEGENEEGIGLTATNTNEQNDTTDPGTAPSGAAMSGPPYSGTTGTSPLPSPYLGTTPMGSPYMGTNPLAPPYPDMNPVGAPYPTVNPVGPSYPGNDAPPAYLDVMENSTSYGDTRKDSTNLPTVGFEGIEKDK